MRAHAALLLLGFVSACGGSSAQAPPSPPAPPPPPTFVPKSFSVAVSGTGRPVIFIPGLTCDGTVWDGTVAHFGGKIQAHVLSLAGFAGRPPIDSPIVPTAKDEIIEYIKQNHLDHPVIVGHSLGGFMTFWIAESAPELISGAVAVDGGAYLSALIDPDITPEKARSNAARFTAGFKAQPPEGFRDRITKFLGTMLTNPDDIKRIGAVGDSDPKTTIDAMVFMVTTDLRPDLGKITVPFLMLAAGTIPGVPRAAIEMTWKAQVEAIPHHELIIVDNSKHFIMFDQPDVFYAALDKFIDKASPAK
jgi:N-formylmaleamate deformylase